MRDAAKETGISAYTLTAMAGNTIKELPIDVLSKLCHYFECTPNDLFSMEEFEKYQEPEILAA
jgi:DNA-binding Xre family transcriptional regulator